MGLVVSKSRGYEARLGNKKFKALFEYKTFIVFDKK